MEKKKEMNIILAVAICLVLAGVLIIISVKNKANMPSNNNLSDVTNNQPANSADNTNTATNPTTGAEQATPKVAPTGEVAKTGDTVAMNYTGRLANGTVFDSNVDPKFNHVQPFVFTLGAGQVIAGWDKGIVGMKVGEKKTLVISPADGYGAKDYGPIPGNSTLTFDVELLAIKK